MKMGTAAVKQEGAPLVDAESPPSSVVKKAGIMVYLQEEIGDARLRCDQLLRYVDKATTLIEKSSHKDHFFEVAGDLIRGIPETSFKLHKALQAVALAANRIDYEEIKQDLRPEKAEELERVLKDVRVRQVQRRSLPMLNPGNVVEQLRGLAKQARDDGRLDTDSLGALIASLEVGSPKVAEDANAKAAAQLEAMALALENPPEGEMPSRIRLAQVLRKTYAEHLDITAGRKLDGEAEHEFKTAIYAIKEILKGRNSKRMVFSALTSLAKGCAQLGQDDLYEIIWKAGLAVNARWSAADLADYQKTAGSPDADLSRIERLADTLEKTGKDIKHAVSLLTKDAGKNAPQLDNLESYINGLGVAHRTMIRALDGLSSSLKSSKKAADDEKLSRHEEGKSVDPTKDMSEDDAKAWKENTEEYGDKFKKKARGELMLPPSGFATFSPVDAATSVENTISNLKQLYRLLASTSNMRPGAISLAFKEIIVELSTVAWHLNLPDLSAILEKARMKTRVKGVERVAFATENEPQSLEDLDEVLDMIFANARMAKAFGGRANYERMFYTLIKVIANVQSVAENFEVPGTSILDRVIKTFVPYAGGSRPMLAAAEDEKLSRYEEGKPADPTKEMSEEDAKAWKENTEEHKDKFKAATDKVAKKIPAPDDSSIVSEIMNWHGGQGTRLYSVGSTWGAGRDVDADDAEEAYDELKRKRADRDALEAFEEHLSEHGVKVASVDKGAFGSRGRVFLHYVKGGTKRREGPLDPQLAKRRMVALMEDGSVSEADFERKASKTGPTDEDWKAA